MTSTANPDYKYYQKLEGTWKDVKGSCEAVLSRFAGIEIRYASGKLSSSYGVTDAMQLQLNQGGMMIGMMAAAYTIHDGEEMLLGFFYTRLGVDDHQCTLGHRKRLLSYILLYYLFVFFRFFLLIFLGKGEGILIFYNCNYSIKNSFLRPSKFTDWNFSFRCFFKK